MRDANTGFLVLGDMNNGTLSYEQIGAVGPEWKFVDTGKDYAGARRGKFSHGRTPTGRWS